MKISIIGAGAMGCLYGAYLSLHHEVTLVDTYLPQVEALNQSGVFIKATDKMVKNYPIHAIASGQGKEPADLLIIFVKSLYTRDALRENAALYAEDTAVLTLQNGMGNDRIIAEFISEERIIIGTSRHNSVLESPGHIFHSGSGITEVGSTVHNHMLEAKICDALNICGLECRVSEDVKHLIWSKLFVNLTVNSTTCLLNTSIGYITENEYAEAVAKNLLHEALKVAKADGESFDEDTVLDSLRDICKNLHSGRASMCQDRQNRRLTEIDTINGAVVELGRKYNIKTPYNEMMVNLIHAMEGTYHLENNLGD